MVKQSSLIILCLFFGFLAKAQHPYTEFQLKDSVYQLFILPIKFKSPTKEEFAIDLIMTDTVTSNSKIPVKFTVLSSTNLEPVQSVSYESSIRFKINELDEMFTEKTKKGYEIRYSGTIPVKSIYQLYQWNTKIILTTNKKKVHFEMTKKSKKKLEKIHTIISEYYEIK